MARLPATRGMFPGWRSTNRPTDGSRGVEGGGAHACGHNTCCGGAPRARARKQARKQCCWRPSIQVMRPFRQVWLCAPCHATCAATVTWREAHEPWLAHDPVCQLYCTARSSHIAPYSTVQRQAKTPTPKYVRACIPYKGQQGHTPAAFRERAHEGARTCVVDALLLLRLVRLVVLGQRNGRAAV